MLELSDLSSVEWRTYIERGFIGLCILWGATVILGQIQKLRRSNKQDEKVDEQANRAIDFALKGKSEAVARVIFLEKQLESKDKKIEELQNLRLIDSQTHSKAFLDTVIEINEKLTVAMQNHSKCEEDLKSSFERIKKLEELGKANAQNTKTILGN